MGKASAPLGFARGADMRREVYRHNRIRTVDMQYN